MLVGYVERGDYKSIDKLIDGTVKVSVRNPRDVDVLGERFYYNVSGVLIDVSAKYIKTYSIIDIPQYNSRLNFKENINILKRKFKELCDLTECENNDNIRLLTMIDKYIDEHFTENSLDLTKIAENVKVEPKYLSAYFKKHKNITLVKYITQKRIECAKQLLKDTDLAINAIAIKVGFTDLSVFGKSFKRSENITPSEYRKVIKH